MTTIPIGLLIIFIFLSMLEELCSGRQEDARISFAHRAITKTNKIKC
jgi:hypothetical protein